MYRNRSILNRFTVLMMAFVVALSCINEKDPMPQQRKTASVLLKVKAGADETPVKAAVEATDQEKVINSLRIFAFTDG